MPMNNGHYVAPTWVNYGPPALDADELNAIDQKLLVAGNIKSGVTILGVDGGPNVNDTTLTSTAAGAGDIALGKQAWANGVLLTGTGSQPTISLSDGVLSIS